MAPQEQAVGCFDAQHELGSRKEGPIAGRGSTPSGILVDVAGVSYLHDLTKPGVGAASLSASRLVTKWV
jgi:hypothetical protein